MSNRRRCFYDDPKHRKASDDAADLDCVFFTENPLRTMRVRKMLQGELPTSGTAHELAFYSDNRPEDITETVLVYKRNYQFHARIYFEFCFVPGYGPVPSDQELDEIFPEHKLRKYYPPEFWDQLFQHEQASSRELVH
jgi:hypothetical protein